jgi:hypothetical protein
MGFLDYQWMFYYVYLMHFLIIVIFFSFAGELYDVLNWNCKYGQRCEGNRALIEAAIKPSKSQTQTFIILFSTQIQQSYEKPRKIQRFN